MKLRVASSLAKVTKSTSFLTCIRNEVDLVPLACEDAGVDVAQMSILSSRAEPIGQFGRGPFEEHLCDFEREESSFDFFLF